MLHQCLKIHALSFSDGNVNSGQVSSHSLNKSFSLQTPAYDFAIENRSVSDAFYTCAVDICCNLVGLILPWGNHTINFTAI